MFLTAEVRKCLKDLFEKAPLPQGIITTSVPYGFGDRGHQCPSKVVAHGKFGDTFCCVLLARCVAAIFSDVLS